MDASNATKPNLWQKDSLRPRKMISLKPFPQLSNWAWSVCCWLLLYSELVLGALNINNGFLHCDLHEEVYIELPQGVTPLRLGQVCSLKKSLNGLRQVNQQWYKKLSCVLIPFSYNQSLANHSIFVKAVSPSSFTALLIYVDDMILTCK